MKKILLLLMMGLAAASLPAQTLSPVVIAAAGNYFEKGNLSLSWTLGETAVTTLENGSLLLTQGFQQPYETATGINDRQAFWANKVWPNPVRNVVHIVFSMKKSGTFILTLTDMTGRKLRIVNTGRIEPGQRITLDMTGFHAGVYFLRITPAGREHARIFKLIKD